MLEYSIVQMCSIRFLRTLSTILELFSLWTWSDVVPVVTGESTGVLLRDNP